MKAISCVIIGVFAVANVRGNFEVIDETAWMDDAGRDKYFEYSEEAAAIDLQNYSNKIDVSEFDVKKSTIERRHLGHVHEAGSKILDFFVDTFKSVVKPPSPPHHEENETSKGIDFKLGAASSMTPSFGKNEDLQLIYLGTKWCGAGDIAKNKRDIGYFYMTDNCCRSHDFCPHQMGASSEKFGLKNTGKFTRSHCDCDAEFYRCLKAANTLVSNQIGLIYFNILGPQCFKEEHPVKCMKYHRGRCEEYKRNESQPKLHQWFDNRWY